MPVTSSPALFAYRLGRRLVRVPVLQRFVPKALRSKVQARLSSRVMDQLPDRQYLERTILPAIRSIGVRQLLDVGVQDYSRHYWRLLGPHCERWTLDVDQSAAEHGSPGRHVVGDAVNLARYFEPGSFDMVMLNGLFGHGIDTIEEQTQVLAHAREVLAENGWLLVGWNRAGDGLPLIVNGGVTERQRIGDPVTLEIVRRSFSHEAPGDLPARKEFADSSHVFDWFRAR